MRSVDQPLIDRGKRREDPQEIVVVLARRLRHRAMCSCGWDAGKRVFLGAAKADALIHAAETGHEPALPLVWGCGTVGVNRLPRA
jgi:hypothetical protein